TSSQVVFSLVDSMIEEGDEVITLYFGEDVSEEEAQRVARDLENFYKNVEVECCRGGQPLYYYFISIE
ncbi:MAG: DAK2 domain-containing protein, partial [Tindallia sp. MSAO_Bac2]